MNSFARTHTAALLVAVLLVPAATRAQTPWHEGFEGPQPSWRDAGGDAQYRVRQHQRLQQNAHTGDGCEWLQVEGDGGSHVYFAHDVGRPRVIDELAPSIWIKADRPNLYLALRVVLPRTTDPRSGQPVVTILTGAAYTDVGRWQQLRLAGVPTLLTRQIHLLRMQLGPQVDGREAYVDAVLLNVYGGPGTTNVWIDDLVVAGHVALGTGPSQENGSSPAATVPGAPEVTATSGTAPLAVVRLPAVQPADQASPPSRGQPTWLHDASASGNIRGTIPSTPASDVAPRRVVKMAGSELRVNDRPTFPRVIQHRGEPLAFLKQTGFNAVWLQRLPAPELLEEADRLDLWLICPPPRALTPIAEIGPAFDSVLAWDLGNCNTC